MHHLVKLGTLVLLLVTHFAQAEFGSRSCKSYYNDSEKKYYDFAWDERRGNPAEFDPGPADADSESWLKLYGQLPNYRSIGSAIMGPGEKFRWNMGPMWYRGRLGKNQVKVFIVGQEGAQDENITNRAFTGSTGTRIQKFLNHLGIYESYLFMNTYVYTIKGQRVTEEDPTVENYIPLANYVALEQGANSPIVQYRNMLFDNVIRQNPETIALFIGVGGGGKESLATWINSHSGNTNCRSYSLQYCNTQGLVQHFVNEGVLQGDEKILAVGVPHPGGAAFGNAGEHLRQQFSAAATDIKEYMDTVPGWLPADPQENQFRACSKYTREDRLNYPYQYGYAPIPFKDFSFGSNWNMGNGATTSNRPDSHLIQVFSEQGHYAIVRSYDPTIPLGTQYPIGKEGRQAYNDTQPVYDYYPMPADAKMQIRDWDRGLLFGMKDTEVPYEPPRFSEYGKPETGDLAHVSQFDPGPATPAMAQALMNWPNFKEIDSTAYYSDESFGFGATYRGNTKDPKVVIIADQMGHTDMFSTRALTGEGGQRLQAFLKATGLEEDNSYLILRALPVDTVGIAPEQTLKLALTSDPEGKSAVQTLTNVLKEIKNPMTVLAMGPISQAVAKSIAESQSIANLTQVVDLEMPDREHRQVNNWLTVAAQLGKSPTAAELAMMPIIPRRDLPYSSRWWMGTSGDRGARAYGTSEAEKVNRGIDFDYSGHYYQLEAPYWVGYLQAEDPRPLNSVEIQQIDATLQAIENASEESQLQ